MTPCHSHLSDSFAGLKESESLKYSAAMPSNIALIKYMGKVSGNRATNSSLSYTLAKFKSLVEITRNLNGVQDTWEPFEDSEFKRLGPKEIQKFLNFFKLIKAKYNSTDHFVLRSKNDFPASCGIASSASSFAALTVAAHLSLTNSPLRSFGSSGYLDAQILSQLSDLSRQGSGSSCRSFFGPWTIWDSEGARSCQLDLKLQHFLVLVDSSAKLVSSSEAHQRVTSSLNFKNRSQRAETRLAELLHALENHHTHWAKAFEICWAEFWDMHSLFETSHPPFGYMTANSLRVLEILGTFWKQHGDGPLVTMDAGANIHLLFRSNPEKCLAALAGFKILGDAVV